MLRVKSAAHRVAIWTRLLVDNTKVKQATSWPMGSVHHAYHHQAIVLKFADLVEGVSIAERVDEATGIASRLSLTEITTKGRGFKAALDVDQQKD